MKARSSSNGSQIMVQSSYFSDNSANLTHLETIKLIRAIEQSGVGMKLYRDNQIQRMKISRGIFSRKVKETNFIEHYIEQVLEPFGAQINSFQLNVYISRSNNFNQTICQDWKLYQLILFNLIQNAIKYN